MHVFFYFLTAAGLSDRRSVSEQEAVLIGWFLWQCLILSLRLADQRGVRTDHHNDTWLGRTELYTPPSPFSLPLTHIYTQNTEHTHISHILKGFSETFHNAITMVISCEEHTCVVHTNGAFIGTVVTSATHVTTSNNQTWIRSDQSENPHNPGSPVNGGLEYQQVLTVEP